MLRIVLGLLVLGVSAVGCASEASSVGQVGAVLESGGFWAAFALVYAGGFLVSLTPCVYPMIPITLGIIGARNAAQSPLVGFVRSFAFVLGIVVVYAALGLVAVKTGRQVSFAFQNPWVIGGIAVFFAAMGASMLDLFSLQMPTGVAGRLQGFASSHSAGLAGAFLLGGVTGVVASPCGSPVLAGVVAVAAGAESTLTGVLLLAAYALGLGTLFVFLGAFPSLLSRLPKSGGWMSDVKKILGLLLIAVALYLLKDALAFKAFAAVLAVGAVVLVGLCAHFAATSKSVRLWTVSAAVFAASAVWVGVAQKPIVVSHSSSVAAQEWLTDFEQAKEIAKREDRPILLDFGAEWCAACKRLERETFAAPNVASALARFVKVKVDCTEETDENLKLQMQFQATSLPTVAFLKPDGTWLKELTLYQFEPPAAFLERLSKMQ